MFKLTGKNWKSRISKGDLRIFIIPSSFIPKRHQLLKSAVSDIGITQFATQNFAHQLSSPRKFDARSISSSCKLIEGPGQATGPNHISVAFLGDRLSVLLLSVVGTSKSSIDRLSSIKSANSARSNPLTGHGVGETGCVSCQQRILRQNVPALLGDKLLCCLPGLHRQ